MQALPTIKRGDTLAYKVGWEGVELSELRSQVRNRVGRPFVADMTIEPMEDGSFLLSVDTSSFPLRDLIMDIKHNRGGLITSSETLTLRVEEGVTVWPTL